MDRHPGRTRRRLQREKVTHRARVITERAAEKVAEPQRLGPDRQRCIALRTGERPRPQSRRADGASLLGVLARGTQITIGPVQRMAATSEDAHRPQSRPTNSGHRTHRVALRDRGGDTGAVIEVNILGGRLQACGHAPMTGFYRDGCCRTGPEDQGSHTICAVVTAEFLEHQRSIGNDLSTPVPLYGFPGLSPGDRWCVTARNWLRAHDDGAAAFVVLAATHERALEIVPRAVLEQYAVDVPEDPGALQA